MTTCRRLVVVACLQATACAPSMASLAREGQYLQACRKVFDANLDEQREAQLELIRRANVRVRYRRVPEAELARLVEHPIEPSHGATVTVDLDVLMNDGALRMSVLDQKFDIWKVQRVDLLSYLASLGIPPMPHQERVLAQGSEHRDETARIFAILGHMATGGALFVPWTVAGGDPGALVPDARVTKEPDLTEAERHDIAEWARRDDVLAATGRKPRRFFMAGTGDEALVHPAAPTTLRSVFWNAESPAGRTGSLAMRSLPGYWPDAFAVLQLSLSVQDKGGKCEFPRALVRIDLATIEDELARRVRSRPRRLTDIVESLERRGWMSLGELEIEVL